MANYSIQNLKLTYTFEKGPHIGRYQRSERKIYFLSDRLGKKPRVLVLKQENVAVPKHRKEYNYEVSMNKKCNSKFPTKYLYSFIEGQVGNIVTQYMANIKWSDIPKQYEQTAINNFAKQLSELHICGYIHNDLAPKNVLVNKKGITSLIDFEDALPSTHINIKNEWNIFRSLFYNDSKRLDCKKYIRLFNYAQLAAPNNGYLLQIDKIQRGITYFIFCTTDLKEIGGLCIEVSKYIYISNVYILPNFQNRYMCTKMMRLFTEIFHYRKLILEVDPSNLSEIECYKNVNFIIDKKLSNKQYYVMVCNI